MSGLHSESKNSMPSEGLQRLQRLSATATQLPTVQPKTPPRHKKRGSFATNILFLPFLALLLVLIALLTPGLSDFLPHSRHPLDSKKTHVGSTNKQGDAPVRGRRSNVFQTDGFTSGNLGQASKVEQVQQDRPVVHDLLQTAGDAKPKPDIVDNPLHQNPLPKADLSQTSVKSEKVATDQPEIVVGSDKQLLKDPVDEPEKPLKPTLKDDHTGVTSQLRKDDGSKVDSLLKAVDAATFKQVDAAKDTHKDPYEEAEKELHTEEVENIYSVLDDVLNDDDDLLEGSSKSKKDSANIAKTKGDNGIKEGAGVDGTDFEQGEDVGQKVEPISKACVPGCSWHGTCVAGSCECAVAYSGTSCGNHIFLSWPFVADSMKNFTSHFEGNFILHKTMGVVDHLQIVNGKDGPQPSVNMIASEETMKELLPVLPDEDRVLKAVMHKSCAVVGASGNLLHYKHGPEIDEHDMVMRFNGAQTEGLKFYVGSKTTHRVTNLQNWGYHESNIESIFVPASVEAVEGLLWNSKQQNPRNVYVFHPDFEQYVAQSFGFIPDTGMYGLLLALQRCRKIRVYGFSTTHEEGVPYHYYDGCDTTANHERDLQQRQVLITLAKAGLFEFGDPCTLLCLDPKAAKCNDCRTEHNFITEPEYPQAEDCVESRSSSGHYPAPWMKPAADTEVAKQ